MTRNDVIILVTVVAAILSVMYMVSPPLKFPPNCKLAILYHGGLTHGGAVGCK